jgi:prespore-specific regulator
MSAVRQDAWSDEDDMILAEVTLRHIRDGSTQLAAFDEVGERIGRTGAACGFRWNSYVRKKYEAAIQIAKSQRQKRTKARKRAAIPAAVFTDQLEAFASSRGDAMSEESLTIDAVIRFLRGWKGTYQEMARVTRQLEKELLEKNEELERMKQEKELLNRQVNEVESDYKVVNDDYKALIQIMDRARKLAFLAEDDEENKSRFKMDLNGNLERID